MSDLKENATAAIAKVSAPYVAAGDQKPGPDTPSGDHVSMQPLWEKVRAISGGVDSMRKAARKYVPKFDLEDDADYKLRIDCSPFTNVYEDVSGGLASKPFSREVQFEDADDVDPFYKEFYEDVDGQGNNLHVFSDGLFQDGLDNAIAWILIDHTKMPPLPEGRTSRSISEEQSLGARPYWVHVAGSSVVAAYSAMVRGKEVFTHVRILEPTLERDGYGEVIKQRVRIFDRRPFTAEDGQDDYHPATWELQEKQKQKDSDKWVWVSIDGGDVSIGVIPVVPFRTGRRQGNGWAVKAPLEKLADMQMDAFQQESNLRNIELLTCYPMLTANGVAQPQPADGAKGAEVRVRVGPRAVLWAPPQPGGQGAPGSWQFIEPSAESVKVLQAERDGTWSNMREIGMQPLAEANITVITSANVSVKAKSALQAWALRLKDALEQAFEVTALWVNKQQDEAPGVDVYRDFGVDLQSGQELTTLETMAKDGLLSGETLRAEAKRRNVLSENFKEDEEQLRLATEAAGAAGDGEEDIDPATGEPLSPANDPGGPGEEPVDPGEFEDASEIDDETLLKLFGKTSAGAA